MGQNFSTNNGITNKYAAVNMQASAMNSSTSGGRSTPMGPSFNPSASSNNLFNSRFAGMPKQPEPPKPVHNFISSSADYQPQSRVHTPGQYNQTFQRNVSGRDLSERMNSVRGLVPQKSTDGTNCMRSISNAIPKNDSRYFLFGGGNVVNTDDAISRAKAGNMWHPESDPKKVPANAIMIDHGGHATVATSNGVIQSGNSRNGVYYSGGRDYAGTIRGYIPGTIQQPLGTYKPPKLPPSTKSLFNMGPFGNN